MILFSTFLSDAVQIAILASVLYSLWRMIALTRESRENRALQTAAIVRAETAAADAARHARETAITVSDTAQRIDTLEINTNSIKDALVLSTAKASDLEGEKRGLAIAAAAQAEKDNKT